jgi:hypothetical protein
MKNPKTHQSKFSILYLVIGVLMIGALACNLGGSGDTEVPPSNQEPTEEPESQSLMKPTSAPEEPPPTAAPASVELEIVNESSEVICYVYIAPSASDSWGTDQLGEETIIAPGESFSVYDIPPGSYDLLAQDCEENVLVESNGEVFEDDLYTWTIFDQTAYGDTMMVTDDYNSIQMEVPSTWNDLKGEPWYDGGDVIGASIWASPDLDGFSYTWETPGVIFSVSDDLSKLGGYIQLLDILRDDALQYCELEGRYDYEDPLYRGKYDLFEKCGGPGGADYMVLSAVSKDNQYSYLILVEMQFVSDEDWAVREVVLDSFEVIGNLP